MLKVWPKNDEIRKLIFHPSSGGIYFHEEGPIDWPNDSFTARRVADGDVLLEEPSDKKPKKSAPDVGKV